jgi:hypothetical protein
MDEDRLLVLASHFAILEDGSPSNDYSFTRNERFYLWQIAPLKLIMTKHVSSLKKHKDLSLWDSDQGFSRMRPVAISEEETIGFLGDKAVTSLPAGTVLYPECRFPSGSRWAQQDGLGKPIIVYQRRRPLEWYGVFWLPEFYLVALCALGLAWSIRRDGRTSEIGSVDQRTEMKPEKDATDFGSDEITIHN